MFFDGFEWKNRDSFEFLKLKISSNWLTKNILIWQRKNSWNWCAIHLHQIFKMNYIWNHVKTITSVPIFYKCSWKNQYKYWNLTLPTRWDYYIKVSLFAPFFETHFLLWLLTYSLKLCTKYVIMLELVSKESNHLAAICMFMPGVWFLWKKKNPFSKRKCKY